MAARISQVAVEVVVSPPDPRVRVSQIVVEAVVEPARRVLLSQFAVEAVILEGVLPNIEKTTVFVE